MGASALSLMFGLLVGGDLGHAFVALAVVLPAVLLQDAWRFAFFAAGDGRKAFVNDAVWGVALVPALILATAPGSEFGFLLAWGASG